MNAVETTSEAKPVMQFVRFMSTPAGRGLRVAMGVALIATGINLGGRPGWGLAAFGLLPLVTGAGNICPVCPLLNDAKRGEAGCTSARCSGPTSPLTRCRTSGWMEVRSGCG